MNIRKTNRRGQTLAEYGVIIAGILVISLAAVSIFGDKVSDLWGTAAVILPGAQLEDNAPILTGTLIEHTDAAAGMTTPITIDLTAILNNSGTFRLGNNLFGDPAAPGGQGDVLPDLVPDF